MKLIKVNNIKFHVPKSSIKYDFPKYNITDSNDFLFVLLLGIKNSGKTVCALNYLMNEKHLLENQNKAYFFTPSVNQQLLDFQNQHPNNFEIIEEFTIKTFTETIDKIKETIEHWKYLIELIKKFKKDNSLMSINEIMELDKIDFDNFNFNYPPIHSVFIDDALGNEMISSRGKNAQIFMNFAIKHRHLFTNLFIMSQYPKQLNKCLRSNSNIIHIWQMKDRTIYEAIFPEFASLFKNDLSKFLEIMDLIEERNNHSFLTIYYDKEQWIRINFDEEILLNG
jgi:hypothetical protein